MLNITSNQTLRDSIGVRLNQLNLIEKAIMTEILELERIDRSLSMIPVDYSNQRPPRKVIDRILNGLTGIAL